MLGAGAVTLIQRFASAVNLNIYLHCLVLDGVYRFSTPLAIEFVLYFFVSPRCIRSGFLRLALNRLESENSVLHWRCD
jgi:hypothetical protein